MSETPPETGMGRVVRRLLDGHGDPVSDVKAMFRPRPGEVRTPAGTVLPRPVEAETDDDGWLRHGGKQWVDLIAADPSHTPALWQWEVAYTSASVLAPTRQVFDLAPGQVLDLDTVMPAAPVQSMAVVTTTVSASVAEAAAVRAEEAAERAASTAVTPAPGKPGRYLIPSAFTPEPAKPGRYPIGARR
jgi:hypothetical protein